MRPLEAMIQLDRLSIALNDMKRILFFFVWSCSEVDKCQYCYLPQWHRSIGTNLCGYHPEGCTLGHNDCFDQWNQFDDYYGQHDYLSCSCSCTDSTLLI